MLCDFWIFPKLTSPLKGKRFQTIDVIQENMIGQLMAMWRTVWGPKVPILKGTEESLSYVQCSLYFVSPSINVSIFHITWVDTFWTDFVYLSVRSCCLCLDSMFYLEFLKFTTTFYIPVPFTGQPPSCNVFLFLVIPINTYSIFKIRLYHHSYCGAFLISPLPREPWSRIFPTSPVSISTPALCVWMPTVCSLTTVLAVQRLKPYIIYLCVYYLPLYLWWLVSVWWIVGTRYKIMN